MVCDNNLYMSGALAVRNVPNRLGLSASGLGQARGWSASYTDFGFKDGFFGGKPYDYYNTVGEKEGTFDWYMSLATTSGTISFIYGRFTSDGHANYDLAFAAAVRYMPDGTFSQFVLYPVPTQYAMFEDKRHSPFVLPENTWIPYADKDVLYLQTEFGKDSEASDLYSFINNQFTEVGVFYNGQLSPDGKKFAFDPEPDDGGAQCFDGLGAYNNNQIVAVDFFTRKIVNITSDTSKAYDIIGWSKTSDALLYAVGTYGPYTSDSACTFDSFVRYDIASGTRDTHTPAELGNFCGKSYKCDPDFFSN